MPKRKRRLWTIFGTISHPQIARRLLHWLDLDELPAEMKLIDEVQAVVNLPYPSNWVIVSISANKYWDCPRNGTWEVYVIVSDVASQAITLRLGTTAMASIAVSEYFLRVAPTNALTIYPQNSVETYFNDIVAPQEYYSSRGSIAPEGFKMNYPERLYSTKAFKVRYRRIA